MTHQTAVSKPQPPDSTTELLQPKPRARGWIHLMTTPVVLAIVMLATALPDSLDARISVAVFGFTSVLLFGASAVYHRGNWSPKIMGFLKRLDHSNIFLLIAGTYTPLAVLLLEESTRQLLLTVVWLGAILGVVLRQSWLTAPRWVYVPIYLALGWVAIWFLGDFQLAGGTLVVLFIVLGGVFYTLGAVAYAFKRPNFFPKTFGFHEIFHACTVVAWACHLIAILASI